MGITSLQMEGNKFYKEHKASKETLSIFFDKYSERDRVRKMVDGVYNRKDLMRLWVDIAEVAMRMITLNGHYVSIFLYHFTILDHFRHDRKIYMSFCLLSYLENSLSNHEKN